MRCLHFKTHWNGPGISASDSNTKLNNKNIYVKKTKNGLEIDENCLKWLDMYRNCFTIQNRSGHVKISYAAAMG